MANEHYEFDNKDFSFNKSKRSIWRIIKRALKWIVITSSLAAFYYIIFSMFISTEQEKKLRQENKMYKELYPKMQAQLRLDADVINGLKLKDDNIYEEIFHTPAPSLDGVNSLESTFNPDSFRTSQMIHNTSKKADKLLAEANRVSSNFKSVFDTLASRSYSLPPMFSPIKHLTYAEIGASIGMKINPFLKVKSQHNGLDIIAAQGAPVFATAEGYVEYIENSRKGMGKVVVIHHINDYITKYAHLEEIKVVKGQKVDSYTIIGTVGMSGKSYAPHLHYEVWRNGVLQNPVNYLFASLNPKDYVNVLYMAANTKQSLD